ncbi:MAG: zinc-ribbon domain containing protein [Chloroflexi bacterium]|nr:zinc-ribbon domain containing protein [Chloroflexota bacterium]MCL5075963.1 zinc-ribbon domain containing protein [Chloroflexota bacterium]
MSMVDKTLQCRECGASFVFTAGEQEFYASHGLRNEPTRCPSCRTARRSQRYGDRSWGSDRAYTRTPREMYPAVCAECGAQTTVPFLPKNDKPVYCSDCYDKIRSRR